MENIAFNNLLAVLKNAPSGLGAEILQEYRKTQTRMSGTRMYAGAKQSRLTSGWGQTTTSADSELSTSLRILRARSRTLMRDAPYAKRAKIIVVNNVVGAGMGMQAQVKMVNGKLNNRINDDIEATWEEWTIASQCHTGGVLHFADMERMVMGQIFETGEIFIRKHYRVFGNSSIPFGLEIIEPERVIDEFQPSAFLPGGVVRFGIESDEFRRPVGYWIRKLHPGEIRYSAQETDAIEFISADQIYHLKITDRWPQTRGEPWLHAVMRKLNDVDGYSEAEIIGARAASCYMATIETEYDYGNSSATETPNTKEIVLEPGIVERLGPREKLNFVNPNRPNSNMDPFMRLMLREIAAGIGVSYESLSRDYSQSNYSSSRLALLDDRDLWRVLQLWFIRNFRIPLHREWLQQAVLARVVSTLPIENYALDIPKFNAVRFKPRGWTWIDPEKEVAAYKEAIKANLTTMTKVISSSGDGMDIEDVFDERRNELDMAKERNLISDTDPDLLTVKAVTKPKNPNKTDMEGMTDETKDRKAISLVHNK
jgi:lambda family phage portal protein